MAELPLTFAELEAQRLSVEERLRSENDSLSLRMRRSISWGLRGDDAVERDDPDGAYVFYWIALNAAYGEEQEEHTEEREHQRVERFLRRIVRLDYEGSIFRSLWVAYSGPIRVLLENPYVYGPFWSHYNGRDGYENWNQRFESEQHRVRQALGNEDALTILAILFNRLYVLRNQLVHGGATWGGSVNRDQVRDGVALLGFLTPQFIALMLNNPIEDWGPPYYPYVGDGSQRERDHA